MLILGAKCMFPALTFAKVVIKTETSRPLNETWNFMQRKNGLLPFKTIPLLPWLWSGLIWILVKGKKRVLYMLNEARELRVKEFKAYFSYPTKIAKFVRSFYLSSNSSRCTKIPPKSIFTLFKLSVFAILSTKYNLGRLIYALRLIWSILLA